MNRRSRIVLVLLVLVFNAALYGAKAYVTNAGNNSVSIFDTTTNAVTGIVQDLSTPTFNSPQQVAITPDGLTAYVVNQGARGSGASVSVIDVATDAVTQKVDDPMSTFNGPFGIAITPDGTKAYVTNRSGVSVSVIDIASNMVIKKITDPSISAPSGIAITPDGNKAYVASQSNNMVSIINIASDIVTGVVTDLGTFNGPFLIAMSPDRKTAYVTNFSGNTVSVVDVATDSVNVTTPTILNANFSRPFDVSITADGVTAYVTNRFNNTVSVIDVATNSVDSGTPTVLNSNFSVPEGIVFTQDGTTAYVANLLNNTVSIITVATNTVADPGTVTDLSPATFNTPNFIAIVPLAIPPTPTQSITLSGVQKRNIFLTQTDYINIISWTTPTNVTPVSYTLYRDAALTTAVGTVAVGEPLFFADHNRNPTISYTYYLVAVDQAGNKTLLGNVTVRGLQQIG